MKLGEILIGRGLITDDGLLEALNAQLIYGGHLGTCLIEKGHISEQQLGEVLAETFDVPWATTECFENIPLFVVDTLSKTVVERHRAVPFRLEKDGRLHVAMLDPSDLRAVDEIGFAAGRKISTWVAPEVRLMQALDRYYKVARRMRFVTLAAQLDNDAGARFRSAPKTPLDRTVVDPPPRSPAHASAATGRAPAAMDAMTAAVLDATAVCSGPVAGGAALKKAAKVAPEDPLDGLAATLCGVTDPARLGDLVLEHTALGVGRSLLLQIRAGNAVVWDWRGFDMTRKKASTVQMPITTEPLFTLMMGDGYYRGPVPQDDRFDSFFGALGLDRPGEIVLAPAYADDRLVALLYCDDGPSECPKPLDHDTRTYCRIGKKLGLAMNLIHIKQMLLTV